MLVGGYPLTRFTFSSVDSFPPYNRYVSDHLGLSQYPETAQVALISLPIFRYQFNRGNYLDLRKIRTGPLRCPE